VLISYVLAGCLRDVGLLRVRRRVCVASLEMSTHQLLRQRRVESFRALLRSPNASPPAGLGAFDFLSSEKTSVSASAVRTDSGEAPWKQRRITADADMFAQVAAA
jgi:hypothetical protein